MVFLMCRSPQLRKDVDLSWCWLKEIWGYLPGRAGEATCVEAKQVNSCLVNRKTGCDQQSMAGCLHVLTFWTHITSYFSFSFSQVFMTTFWPMDNRVDDVFHFQLKCLHLGSPGGAAVWRLPLAQGAILETRDRIPRRAPGAWSLPLPLPVSLPLSLSVTIINK